MGLATGEAELREGDYFGAVLNRAARVMAAGHGGQVLLDGTTAGLCSSIDLIALGPRRLRDIAKPVEMFQVLAVGLRSEFPPLKTLDATPGNLRPPTTSFIGREAELAEVQEALKAHRLVTLTGVGGVGKTRLATEVAARLADEFPDGVWFFELAAVADPAAVPDAVAAVLGITQQPGKSVSDSVAAALEGRVRLLVFDNCEHVRDAAADLVEAILAHSATVRVLATSREGLGVADEQLWLVPSLEVRAGIDSAAVTLFVERARSVASRFSVATADEAAAVVEICRRLDGIPLAIELAASRMASMTASEVRDRLDQRFRLLVGSRRGLARHHTLRHAVAWSYDHLDDAEKALLERCSVFAGGFDLQSACAVGGFDDSDDYAILDLLDALVRKSLLVADRSSGRTRFSMLETIRQFAEEQLVAGGEATEVRTAHARYFAGREADILALWDSPRQREAYDWFAVELANLRTAFRWAADHGDLDVAAAIATYAAFLGFLVENYEPIAGPKNSSNPPAPSTIPAWRSVCDRVAVLHAGRIEEAVGYSDAAQPVQSAVAAAMASTASRAGSALVPDHRPARTVGRVVPHPARTPLATLTHHQGMPGPRADERRGAVRRRWPPRTVSSTPPRPPATPMRSRSRSSRTASAFRDADPDRALEAARRGLVIAQDSGNRFDRNATSGRPVPRRSRTRRPAGRARSLHLAIRHLHDSGNTANIRPSVGSLAAFLDRLGRHEPAATIAGFALSPLPQCVVPKSHRDRPPARGPRRRDLRIACPQGRDDDHRRSGDLRIRPNRPGPSRTERGLVIDDLQESQTSCQK